MGVETIAMRIGHGTGRDRHALAAFLAVFALLVQALTPAAAMAVSPDPAGVMVICTSDGTTTVAADGAPARPKGFAGLPCLDCLAAAMAVVTTPELAVQRVAYTVTRIEHAAVSKLPPPRARAPPRPPGQGPPTA